ncbi:type II secretion system protein J [Paradesertivirga mongoliensis]|uniref:Type II secretion system protein J n=1 Tax=Paradesertivirga mongoliensis TaxID=2100740 RepID=A0ABW4ZL49_9SPHI|nr:hypothetical protein [Pedobacter mongoliensis]
MRINSKLNAFTIIEVTVSMLLATISIVIAYTAYRVVSNSYRQFDKKNKTISEFTLTDKMLKRDISLSTKVLRATDGFLLTMPEGEVRYQFQPDYILRNQYNLRTDTLFIRSSELLSVFEQKEVFEGDLVDKISFKIALEDKTIPLSYTKKYSAEELFE